MHKFMISFFFQAEDGIRDGHVTGVQTCALPIWFHASTSARCETPQTTCRGVQESAEPSHCAAPPAQYPVPQYCRAKPATLDETVRSSWHDPSSLQTRPPTSAAFLTPGSYAQLGQYQTPPCPNHQCPDSAQRSAPTGPPHERPANQSHAENSDPLPYADVPASFGEPYVQPQRSVAGRYLPDRFPSPPTGLHIRT